MFYEKLRNLCSVAANPDQTDKNGCDFGLSAPPKKQIRYKLQLPKNPAGLYRCNNSAGSTPRQGSHQRWLESHFHTSSPLLFQTWNLDSKFFKLENPTLIKTLATIDSTEIQKHLYLNVTFIKTTQTLLFSWVRPGTGHNFDVAGTGWVSIYYLR